MNTMLETQPMNLALGYEPEPRTFLDGPNYVDPKQPFDSLLVDLKKAVSEDSLPTGTQQYALIRGIKNADLSSLRELITSHQCIVAAVAFPFRFDGADTEELLYRGRRTLVKAARGFDRDDEPDFDNYLVTKLHEDFSSRWPELAARSFIVPEDEQPMQSVYHFATTIREVQGPMTKRNKELSDKRRRDQRWRLGELAVMPLLILPREEIIAIAGVSNTIVSRRLASIKRKFGVETKEEAVIEAFKRGVNFELPQIPPVNQFTIRQRQVAMRLDRGNDVIAEELGITERQVNRALKVLYKKTQAQTRAGLAVIAYANKFEPTEEELNPPPIPLPEQLNDLQRDVFRLIVNRPSDKAVAEELGINVGVVENISTRAVAKTGSTNRTQLLLKLHQEGMDFGINMPDQPITELLSAREIDIIKHLHLPYTEIAEMFDYNDPDRIGNIIFRAKKKVGAPNRYALALMVDMIDEDA